MPFLRIAPFVLSLFLLALGPAAAGDDTLGPDHRKAIEQVVREYLNNNPEILVDALKSLREKQEGKQKARSQTVLTSRRPELENDPATPFGGNIKGNVTVVEFVDYQCGYCKRVRPVVEELLRGDDPIEERFAAFCDRPELAELGLTKRRDLASELLRYHDPTSCWLWTRWLWDPRTSTGALPLVTSVFHDLGGSSDAEVYQKVGYALKLVQQTAEAAGFDRLTHSVFGTDVFLSCVYVIYAYTVLKMRMTQEFNKVMPGLSEFSRRLLGVHQR